MKRKSITKSTRRLPVERELEESLYGIRRALAIEAVAKLQQNSAVMNKSVVKMADIDAEIKLVRSARLHGAFP